jgi:two-component system LytT family response regulator
MVNLKTIVVDDELLARRLMLSCLEEIPEIEVLAECANGREAVAAVLELEPDLMFLDIMMPGLNGFEVIKKIQPELLPMVIFCTAHQRYAFDAFDIHAVDYIVKPLDEQRLQLAVNRALARYQEELQSGDNKASLLGAIETITSNFSERLPLREKTKTASLSVDHERKITIKDRDSIKLVKVDSIAWVDAAGDYMCVHVKGVTHVMRSTLKALTARLDPNKFKRIHRSTVVNLDRIAQITAQDKGEFILDLSCDEKLKVSRNYRDAIKAFISDR